MADFDPLEAAAELLKLSVGFETSGPYVAEALDKNVVKYAGLVKKDARATVAVDTGATKRSIDTDITRDGSGAGITTTADIGPTTAWAPYLELGTSRMEAQPFLDPALQKNEGPFVAACEAAAIPPELA